MLPRPPGSVKGFLEIFSADPPNYPPPGDAAAPANIAETPNFLPLNILSEFSRAQNTYYLLNLDNFFLKLPDPEPIKTP